MNILTNRMTNLSNDNSITDRTQSGFSKDFSIIDKIFVTDKNILL